MLLITLLTTLLALPAPPDTTPPKPRPGVGLFYMTGPRAYESKGFVGIQGQVPFAKGKWRATLGVGGYVNYNEAGIRWAESNSYTRGIYEIPVTYERNVSLMGFGGIGYAVNFTNKLYLELGIQADSIFAKYRLKQK